MTAKRGRGERAGLTRDTILSTALRLADTEGTQALSMRRLGGELGVEAMTLYHHVANKEELLDGLVEQVIAEVTIPAPQGDWQRGLRDTAILLRDTLSRHPNVLPLLMTRPAVTDRNLDAVERTLELLRDAGFSLERAADVTYSLIGFVVGYCARTSAQPVSDRSREEHLSAIDPRRYPLLTETARIGAATDDADRFDFTVTAMITGFAATLERLAEASQSRCPKPMAARNNRAVRR